MKKLVSILLSSVLLLSLAACGNSGSSSTGGGASNSSADGEVKGSVAVNGSTTVQEIMDKVVPEFSKLNGGITVDVQGSGSGAGITAVNEGTCDIGMVSRELKEEEKAMGMTETIFAYDGIAVIVNPENKASELTVEQVKDIYTGKITNWKEVGGDDAAIVVVGREAGSGTRGAFEEIVKFTDEMVETAATFDSNGGVQTKITDDKNAIGYLSLGMVDSKTKAVKIGGVEATEANVVNKTYPIQRPLLLLTKGTLTPQAQVFMDFCMSDTVQSGIVTEKYISANAK